MKKSIAIFVTLTILAACMIVYGWLFVSMQIGKATLVEETIMGDSSVVDGLSVELRVDSADDLHWINRFEYGSNESDSQFKRGQMNITETDSIYDTIRFTGWSTVPYYTQIKYDALEGIQDKDIHAYYEKLQQRVKSTQETEQGKIQVKEYLDYYPVSYRFQFGTQVFSSDNALAGLKIYAERDMLSSDAVNVYEDEVSLYTALNRIFKIPVIENEWHEYEISYIKNYDYKTSVGYKTKAESLKGKGYDYYEFDPIIVVQQENILDGKEWYHPDLKGGLDYEVNGKADGKSSNKNASDYNLKNRMLFAVNNRTAKGELVEVSNITDGYGIYELPIDTTATATVTESKRSLTVATPKPLADELKMVYPLDPAAEYVEMSLSDDHRYLAVFVIKDGEYYVDMVDADKWTSQGLIKLFPAAKEMTYAWGEDGTLAVTNHEGYMTLLSRTEDAKAAYRVIYSAKAGNDLVDSFFIKNMGEKDKSLSTYKYGQDYSLAVTSKDGKVALVQNLLLDNGEIKVRTAAIDCMVFDESGPIYRGIIKSNITDIGYDLDKDDVELLESASKNKKEEKLLIKPVGSENRVHWK